MEVAPTPMIIGAKIIKSSPEYKLNSNDKEYSTKIILSNKITINLEEIGNNFSHIYYTELNLEEFRQINKIFKQYDTIEECYDCLLKFFEKNKVIICKELDDLSIKLKINSLFGEFEEIKIPLHKKQLDISNNEKLYQEINELKNKIKSLETETNELKNKISTLQKENKEYKEIIESRLTKLESIIPKYNYNIDSKILSPKQNIDFIIDRLKKYFKFNSDLTFNLIYRASIDGDEPSDFHAKCDNIPNILVLYYTNKYIQFGGFSSVGFDSSNSSKEDLNSFIFNINNKKIYEAKGKNQIGCFEINGPFFGRFSSAIYLYDDINILTKKTKQHKTNRDIVSYEGFNTDFEINNGEEYFNLIELEVFQIK